MQDEGLYSAEDTELLRQLSEGSKTAFNILYNRYWRHVFNTAYKRLDDEQLAQDIAQDVFVQLWVRGTKSPIENLPAYLNVSARNAVFKHFEKQSRLSIVPDEEMEVTNLNDQADSGVLHKEFLVAFRQLIDALPRQQAIIFKMRFEEDLSPQAIADILNISPKTVRNQLGKALSLLKSALLTLPFLLLISLGR